MKIFVGADVPGSHRQPLVRTCERDLARLRAGALRSSELVGVDGRQVAQWGDNEPPGGFNEPRPAWAQPAAGRGGG
jgi:hypothetical protein